MGDHQFKFIDIGRTTSTRLARRAVLGSVFQNARIQYWGTALKCTYRLVGMWRHLVEELRPYGWKPTQGIRNQYTRNCPPSFAFESRDEGKILKRCNNWRVCPWCWGRQVAEETWYRAKEVFYDGLRRRRGADGKRVKLRLAHYLAEESWPMARPVQFISKQTFGLLQIAKHCSPRGALGVAYLAVEYPDREVGEWKIELRALAIVPEKRPIDGATGLWRETPVMDHQHQIGREIAKFASYPSQMILGDPAQIAELLNPKRSYCMKRYSGVFREKNPQGETDIGLSDSSEEEPPDDGDEL